MNALKTYREQAGLTQERLAQYIGKTQAAVGHYENGRRLPGLNEGRRIVQVLNDHGVTCSLNDVFPLPVADFSHCQPITPIPQQNV